LRILPVPVNHGELQGDIRCRSGRNPTEAEGSSKESVIHWKMIAEASVPGQPRTPILIGQAFYSLINNQFSIFNRNFSG
jgi:hypothetical protein